MHLSASATRSLRCQLLSVGMHPMWEGQGRGTLQQRPEAFLSWLVCQSLGFQPWLCY